MTETRSGEQPERLTSAVRCVFREQVEGKDGGEPDAAVNDKSPLSQG